MISALNLLWIVPVAAMFGAFIMAMVTVAEDKEE